MLYNILCTIEKQRDIPLYARALRTIESRSENFF